MVFGFVVILGVTFVLIVYGYRLGHNEGWPVTPNLSQDALWYADRVIDHNELDDSEGLAAICGTPFETS